MSLLNGVGAILRMRPPGTQPLAVFSEVLLLSSHLQLEDGLSLAESHSGLLQEPTIIRVITIIIETHILLLRLHLYLQYLVNGIRTLAWVPVVLGARLPPSQR